MADTKERERLMADKAAIDIILREFWEDMKAKIESNQGSLDDGMKRV